MNGIFFKAVEGGQIKAAAKPPHRFFARLFRNEKPHVGVAGRDIRAARVDHQRHAHRLEAAAGQLGAVRGSGSGQGGAGDVREVHARLFKHRTLGQYAAAATATFFARPAVLVENGAAVGLSQLRADAVLQCQQEGFYFCDGR
ncbi:hypothetical protein D3C72_1951980 [compost metagenome]